VVHVAVTPVSDDGDPYAQRIRLRDLRWLANSARNNGEDTVQAYYGWRDARALTVAKGMSAAALSILTAWFVPFLKSEYKHTSPWLIVVTPVALILALATLGLVSLLWMDRIHQSFIRAMVWLQRLR
jgi:hypothetical protein